MLQDGYSGWGGVSAILKQIHGHTSERAFFETTAATLARTALAPAAVTVPLLLFFKGDLADADGRMAGQSWVGSGGSGGSWGCEPRILGMCA